MCADEGLRTTAGPRTKNGPSTKNKGPRTVRSSARLRLDDRVRDPGVGATILRATERRGRAAPGREGADGRLDRALGRQHRVRDESQRPERAPVAVYLDRGIQVASGAERHPLSRSLGEPPRRAGVLRQRQEVRVRHGARQRVGHDPDTRVPDDNQPVAGCRNESGRGVGVVDEPARILPAADVDEAVALCPHDRGDVSAAGRRARGAHHDHEPERRADARRDRVPSLLPADGFFAR